MLKYNTHKQYIKPYIFTYRVQILTFQMKEVWHLLLSYGNTLVDRNWKVTEEVAPGYCRIYHVHSGDVSYYDGSKRQKLLNDHLYILPSISPYSMRHDPCIPFYCTFVHMDLFPVAVSGLIEISISPKSLLDHILRTLRAAIKKENEPVINSIANTLVMYCSEENLFEPSDKKTSEMLTFISGHLSDNLSIPFLAEKFGYNEQYFIRMFQKRVGITPYKYILNLRLREAGRLLVSNPDMSITEVSEKTGFGDVKSMGRTFKKTYRVSPGEFRRKQEIIP